ncbi:MAG: polysaccharide biosynthesis protein, partial [Acidobacteriota bacterium]
MRVNDFYFYVALIQLPLVIFVQFSAVFLVGGYSIIWRYISIGDLGIFIKAALLSVIVLVLLRVVGGRYITDEWRVSYSVLMIDTILGFGGLVGLRVARRIIYEISRRGGAVRKRVRVKTPALFVGAGRTGANSVTELLANPDSQIEVKGFIDNDRSKLGGRVAGIKVLGMVSDIGRFVDELQVEQVVIALDSSEAEEVRQIIDICTQIPVKTRIVPSISSIADGTVEINRIRDVEIEDLLGREPVALDTANLHELLFSKTVMVTGAGGSIGAELVRQILKFQPSHILLVERAEFSLFEIHRELKDLAGNVELIPIVADVCDRARMTE